MTAPDSPFPTPGDLAGRDFWNTQWGHKSSSRGRIGLPRLRHSEVQHAEMFDRAFAQVGDANGKVTREIGASDSGWPR